MAPNPYAPGAGTAPPVLVGRDIQLAIIEATADLVEAGRRPQHIVLTGLRGTGKTVLLKEALRGLRRRGWLCGYYEVRRDVEVGVAIGTIVAEGSRLLPARAKLGDAIRKLRSSIGGARISGGPDGTVTLEVTEATGRAPRTDPYLEALRVLRQLGSAAKEDGVGVALCIDEAQTFRRRDATTLLQALEADEAEDSRVLLLGAGLPTTPVELTKARTYAERFRYERLDDLTADEARRAVREPAEQERVTWEGKALDRVVELAGGYPFFLQLYASETWNAAQGSGVIKAEHVRVAEPRVVRLLDNGLYATRYERASPSEREYLATMARLMGPSGRARSGDVAKSLDRSLSDLSPVRDRLIRKGVIHAPEAGVLQFSVPGFRQYVLRRVSREPG